MDPPLLNPLLPTQTPQMAEMAEISTVNESVNTMDQTNLAESTLVDQHKRRAWTNKPSEGEQVDHTRDEQGFEKFEDYFSDTDADESLVKPSSAPTSVIQSVSVPTPTAPQESILEPVLEEVNVETPPVILNPGSLEESLPGPVQDSVTGGPGEHPATPPLDAITEAATEEPTAIILEPVEDPVETIAEQVVQEAIEADTIVEESQEALIEREEVVEEPCVEEKVALLTDLQQPTEQLPAELLAEEEHQSVSEVPAVESLVETEEVEKTEESVEEEEAPLTKSEQLDDKASPRRPPNKEEASKAVAEAEALNSDKVAKALAEVKEATESAEEKNVKEQKDQKERRDKIKAAEKAKAEKQLAEKLRADKHSDDRVATTPKKSAADLTAEWSDEEEAKETVAASGTMSDKPKRQRKMPAKLLDGAVEETPKQHKTPKNKKLDLERSDSVKKSHKKQPKNTEEVEESLESIEKELAKPLEKSKSKKESPKKTPKKGPAVKPKEDWMTLIFGENGEKTTKNGKKVVPEETKGDSSLEENEAEEFISKGTPFFTKGKEPKSDSKRGRPRKQDLAAKTDAVTKIGNNMYFYTGPGGSGSPPPLVDNEDEDEMEIPQPSTNTESPKDDKRSRTKRCNECDGCTREDCGNCEMCKDRPKFGGQNKKKQACLMRQCLFNNPVAKTVFDAGEEDPEVSLNIPSPEANMGRRGSRAGSTITSTPAVAGRRSGSGRSSVDSRASTTRTRSVTPPRDEDLPDFDPEKFTPGYVPKTVKKGDEEYVIVVSGVADTGLCGKYWGDLTNLPSRRRSGAPGTEGTPTAPKPAPKKATTPAVEVKKASTPPPKKSHKKQPPPEKSASPAPAAAKSHKKKAETPPPEEKSGRGRPPKRKAEENAEERTQALEPEKGKKRKADSDSESETKGKKRKSEPEETKEQKPEVEKEEAITETYSDFGSPETQPLRTTKRPSSNKKEEAGSSPDKQESPLARAQASVSSALTHGTPAGQQRSVSCVADTSTQREVVVECFAPYDDHRWVNIGKERDGMTPDAVQYARALRPPYHLLSFLRIKGHSTKGMSCTDKNTMVFVCLEGEITVILHTTQFNAKKGDSFYIPPKNYYNLINQKAREAELSLVQFQYDGPLPTVQPQ